MPGGAASASAEVVDGISLPASSVLLVDDEADARELLAEVLEQYGATRSTAVQRPTRRCARCARSAPRCC